MQNIVEWPRVLWAGPPLAKASGAVVLLHGRGRNAEEMIALAMRLDLPSLAYVALPAPGGTFYPQSFLAPREANQPHLDRALARIEELVAEIEAQGTGRTKIGWLGFSQGACLATEYVYRHPGPWGGLAALTGGLIGPPETEWATSASLGGTSVLLATADPDPWVPVARVHQTAEVFRAMGASVEVRVQPGAAHEVTDAALLAARDLLAELGGRERSPV